MGRVYGNIYGIRICLYYDDYFYIYRVFDEMNNFNMTLAVQDIKFRAECISIYKDVCRALEHAESWGIKSKDIDNLLYLIECSKNRAESMMRYLIEFKIHLEAKIDE
jgi:hypothetical protein